MLFYLTLILVLALASAYLLRQWWTGELSDQE